MDISTRIKVSASILTDYQDKVTLLIQTGLVRREAEKRALLDLIGEQVQLLDMLSERHKTAMALMVDPKPEYNTYSKKSTNGLVTTKLNDYGIYLPIHQEMVD